MKASASGRRRHSSRAVSRHRAFREMSAPSPMPAPSKMVATTFDTTHGSTAYSNRTRGSTTE